MKKRRFSINETLLELILGILIFGAAVWLIGIWLTTDKLRFSIGLTLGLLLACFASWHMWKGLDIGLELGDGATKYVTKQNMIRYGIMIVSYGVICFFDAGDPVAAFLGIMGIKAGAYLQPFTHKIYTKRRRR